MGAGPLERSAADRPGSPGTAGAASGPAALADALLPLVGPGRVVVLSGAGLSTESGIPDYRGETGRRRRGDPMTYQEFTGSAGSRRRYWARSHLGWPSISGARPNAGHRAVTRLVAAGLVSGVITQNVDGLHAAAGTPDAVELHGTLHAVVCLDCGARGSREELAGRLDAANPGFRAMSARIVADGDAELPAEHIDAFRTVACTACGSGVLKPDVVFFGEKVPLPRVERCYGLVDAASLLLVVGSSLTVMSGLRFARHAAKHGTPVAIVNQGPTRGDDLAALRLDLPLGPALTALADQLTDRLGG
ncbi:NAD-dependent protein deacetylase [Streptomyces sp. NPDC087270]|uniref:NAD-dependent protein deacetylase n=1 Tax=unclassified Streptomyces TaxID=2593676 RepID=UPI00381CBE84